MDTMQGFDERACFFRADIFNMNCLATEANCSASVYFHRTLISLTHRSPKKSRPVYVNGVGKALASPKEGLTSLVAWWMRNACLPVEVM